MNTWKACTVNHSPEVENLFLVMSGKKPFHMCQLSGLNIINGKSNNYVLYPVESPEFFRFMRQLLKLSSKCEDHIFI